MLLNRAEKLLMNNPLRVALQRHVESRRLIRLGGRCDGATALEMGCGQGAGVEIILDRFGASRVDAFDLDPDMLATARRRLARRGSAVRLWQGDAAKIDAPSGAYDAVFDFGIIHHVQDWRQAVREAARVLRPGGTFYTEEVYTAFIDHPIARRTLEHPKEDRFDHRTYKLALKDAGLEVLGSEHLLGWFGIHAARKPAH